MNTSSAQSNQRSICLIAQPSGFGGTEKQTLDLVKILLEENFCVEFIYSSNKYPSLRFRNILDKRIDFKEVSFNFYRFSAESQIQWKETMQNLKSKTGILLKGEPNLGNLGFILALKRHFKKLIYIEHSLAVPLPPKTTEKHFNGLLPGMGLWRYKEMLIRYLKGQLPCQVIAISESIKTSLVAYYKYPKAKIRVILNGVDWKIYAYDDVARRHFRDKYCIPSDAYVFGMMSRLDKIKRVDIALRAFAEFVNKANDRKVWLVICGEGKEEVDLKTLAGLLNISDRTVFAGYCDESSKIYSMFDAILLTSEIEGLPLSLLEGMAAGCIPIATKTGGVPEVVNSQQLGFLAPVNDHFAVVNAMQKAFELSKEQREEMRKSVISRVRQNFDYKKNLQGIVDILRQLT
ncbi:MAG: glycosyltransferase family 4 protein [Candidatus Omnitrophica bacterium]|nr:glycosyltransferase family 4 protein [Candidatus Omnitrophota bacterium]